MGSRHIYTIRDATIDDMETLLQNMREADKEEVRVFGADIMKILRMSYLGSMMCKAVEHEDGLLCIYGVASIDLSAGIGCPWMLGTKLLESKHKKAILSMSSQCLESVQSLFPNGLKNFVDSRNRKAIRWLKWMGFRFDEPVPIGSGSVPFYPFSMGDGQCAIQ